VVPRGDHHSQLGQTTVQLGQEGIPGLLGRGRRIRGVEHIARHQQRVDLVRLQGLQKPLQEARMLKITRIVPKGVPQMPVGGVQEPQAPGHVERPP